MALRIPTQCRKDLWARSGERILGARGGRRGPREKRSAADQTNNKDQDTAVAQRLVLARRSALW
jgi:hypothetical protein